MAGGYQPLLWWFLSPPSPMMAGQIWSCSLKGRQHMSFPYIQEAAWSKCLDLQLRYKCLEIKGGLLPAQQWSWLITFLMPRESFLLLLARKLMEGSLWQPNKKIKLEKEEHFSCDRIMSDYWMVNQAVPTKELVSGPVLEILNSFSPKLTAPNFFGMVPLAL